MMKIIDISPSDINNEKDHDRQYDCKHLTMIVNDNVKVIIQEEKCIQMCRIIISKLTGTAQTGTVLLFKGYLRSVIISFPTKR